MHLRKVKENAAEIEEKGILLHGGINFRGTGASLLKGCRIQIGEDITPGSREKLMKSELGETVARKGRAGRCIRGRK